MVFYHLTFLKVFKRVGCSKGFFVSPLTSIVLGLPQIEVRKGNNSNGTICEGELEDNSDDMIYESKSNDEEDNC